MKKYGFLFTFLLTIGCVVNTDPSQTTEINPYPQPELSDFKLSPTNVSFQITSYAAEQDFKGFIIYFSTNRSDVNDSKSVDINHYDLLSKIPGFYKYIPYEKYESVQKLTTDVAMSNKGISYHLTVTAFGSNEYFRYIENEYNKDFSENRNHKGWIESDPAPVKTLYSPLTYSFTLTNYNYSRAGSELHFMSSGIFIKTAPADLTLMTNALYFFMYQSAESNYIPWIKSSSEDGGIIDTGYTADPFDFKTLPESGYKGKNYAGFPAVADHLYYLKHNGLYAKIHILTVPAAAMVSNQSGVLSGKIYYLNQTNILSF